MNREQLLKILQGVIFFYDGSTKLYIKNILDLTEEEVLLSSKLFKHLKFYPPDRLKEINSTQNQQKGGNGT